MIEKDNYYVEGSTARQIKYNVYEENVVLKKKKQYRDNRAAKFRLVMSLLIVFVGAITIMYRYAMVTQLNSDVRKYEKQYNTLVSENSLLKVQIEKNTDLVKIKEIAEQKLGMSEPDKHQVINIVVPRNEYTVVLNAANEKHGLLSPVIDKLSGIMGSLY